jgi:hypothetical protein
MWFRVRVKSTGDATKECMRSSVTSTQGSCNLGGARHPCTASNIHNGSPLVKARPAPKTKKDSAATGVWPTSPVFARARVSMLAACVLHVSARRAFHKRARTLEIRRRLGDAKITMHGGAGSTDEEEGRTCHTSDTAHMEHNQENALHTMQEEHVQASAHARNSRFELPAIERSIQAREEGRRMCTLGQFQLKNGVVRVCSCSTLAGRRGHLRMDNTTRSARWAMVSRNTTAEGPSAISRQPVNSATPISKTRCDLLYEPRKMKWVSDSKVSPCPQSAGSTELNTVMTKRIATCPLPSSF